MDALSYNTARRSLAKLLNKVCQDHAPLIITR
jgi:prevent-host-death family protein